MKACPECGAEVPDKKRIIVKYGSMARDGSCNFCHYPHKEAKVWVLEGPQLQVRICPECMAILKKMTS